MDKNSEMKDKKTSDVYEQNDQAFIEKMFSVKEEQLKRKILEEKYLNEERELFFKLIQDKEHSKDIKLKTIMSITAYNLGLLCFTNIFNFNLKMRIWKRFSGIFLGNLAINYLWIITYTKSKIRKEREIDLDLRSK
jgi:hypothetical protein